MALPQTQEEFDAAVETAVATAVAKAVAKAESERVKKETGFDEPRIRRAQAIDEFILKARKEGATQRDAFALIRALEGKKTDAEAPVEGCSFAKLAADTMSEHARDGGGWPFTTYRGTKVSLNPNADYWNVMFGADAKGRASVAGLEARVK